MSTKRTCIIWSTRGHAHICRLLCTVKATGCNRYHHMPYPAYICVFTWNVGWNQQRQYMRISIYIYSNTTARQRVNRSYSLIQKAIRLCPNTYGKPRPKDEMSANLVADGNNVYMHTHNIYIYSYNQNITVSWSQRLGVLGVAQCDCCCCCYYCLGLLLPLPLLTTVSLSPSIGSPNNLTKSFESTISC